MFQIFCQPDIHYFFHNVFILSENYDAYCLKIIIHVCKQILIHEKNISIET